jgi:SHS2 domain-containing protein
LEETFVAAAMAVFQVMVENLDAIRSCQERQITVEHEALDLLLFNFLQEPVYYKDAEQLLLSIQQRRPYAASRW